MLISHSMTFARGDNAPLGRMDRAGGRGVKPSVTKDRTLGCCAGDVVTAVTRASGGWVRGVTYTNHTHTEGRNDKEEFLNT